MFAPKATPGKHEIPILDQIYGTFNSYTVDPENRKLKTSLSPNRERFFHMTYEEMIACEKEGWDVKKLNYKIDRNGNLVMDIPEGHEVLVILK
jgi:hypothetical protein